MDRYNKRGLHGRSTAAHFCKCGQASVIAAENPEDLRRVESEWKRIHEGSGHKLVNFDEWLAIVTKPSLALVA